VSERALDQAKAIIMNESFAEADRLMNRIRAVQSVEPTALARSISALRFASACTDGSRESRELPIARPVWMMPAPAIEASYLAAVMKRLADHEAKLPALVRGLSAQLGTKESLAALEPPEAPHVDRVVVDALASSPDVVIGWLAADSAPKRLHATWAIARYRLTSARADLERRLATERDPAVSFAIHWALAELAAK
jgi:hypothetical protein